MISEPLSTRVRRWRRIQGLTQTEAADLIGVSKGYFSKIETGRQKASAPVERRLEVLIGGGTADDINEPGPEYGLRHEVAHDLTTAEAAALLSIIGPCQAGDTLWFARGKTPQDGDVTLLGVDEGLALATAHPVTRAVLLWPLAGGSPVAATPDRISGVASALLRTRLRALQG